MLKKTKISVLVIILAVSSFGLIAFSGCDGNSLHRYWDMSLCETYSDRIIVHGLTRHGERYAEENDGVLNFPLEVDGRNVFAFRARIHFPHGGPNWSRFNNFLRLVVFQAEFQGSSLIFQPRGSGDERLQFSLRFEERQHSFFHIGIDGGIFRLNSVTFMRNQLEDFYDKIIELYGIIPQNYVFGIAADNVLTANQADNIYFTNIQGVQKYEAKN